MAGAVLVVVSAAPAASPDGSGWQDRINEELGLARSQVLQLDFHVDPSSAVLACLEIDGLPDILIAAPHSVRGGAYEVLVQGPNGLAPAAPSPVRTMRGELMAHPGSRVAASVLADGLYARILLPGGRGLYLEPVGGRVPGAPAGSYVLYDEADVLGCGGACGINALPDALAHRDVGGGQGARAGSPLHIAELACDADYEYYVDHGSSVREVEARINQVINAINLQYESEVGITHTITAILIRTTPSQPYTSNDAVTLLNQFRNYWNANHGSIQRDLAQLFTGKELIGGTIGIAWVGVVCNLSWAYSLVQSDFSGVFSCVTDLSAHEIGHNWNADHCSCANPPYTMNPYITCANRFSPTQSIPEILAFRNTRTCLDLGADPTGACCVATSCTVETEADCTGMGGTYLGDGTDCSGNPCGGGGDEVVNLATSDHATDEGTIASGSYLDTHTQNDVREVLREAHTGGPPSRRVSLLSHTWTFEVFAGSSYSFSIDAHHDANGEGDDFVVAYSLDNVSFTDMLVVTKTADDDALQTYDFTAEIAGTVYVRVEDLDRTPGHAATDSFHVDEMFITSVTGGPDVTPPSAPTGLVAAPGDGLVALDWDDSPAGDLDGYIVYRSLTSGGPYAAQTGVLAASQYTDTNVTNGTTYFYVVTAVDLVGNESDWSDEAVATPQLPGVPTTMSVASIEPGLQNEGGGQKRGRVLVTILDDLGDPVAGATVEGTFTGDFNESVAAVTDAAGVATLLTTETRKGGIDYTFCVDDVTHATLSYDPAGNAETCDSQ
jgi:hypothetical protein